MNNNSSKKDTPVKEVLNSIQNLEKGPSISNLWNLSVSMQSTISFYDTHFKNINKNLKNLKIDFCSILPQLIHTELSQLKSEKIALESEIILLRDKINILGKYPRTLS